MTTRFYNQLIVNTLHSGHFPFSVVTFFTKKPRRALFFEAGGVVLRHRGRVPISQGVPAFRYSSRIKLAGINRHRRESIPPNLAFA